MSSEAQKGHETRPSEGLAKWLSSSAIRAAATVTGCSMLEAMTIIHRYRIQKEQVQSDADLQVLLAYEGARQALFQIVDQFTAYATWRNEHGE